MVAEQFVRFVFILYWTAAGLLLLLAPWTPRWDFMVAHLGDATLRSLGLPWMRGALSGFGLAHLVWGFYDLAAFLRPPEAAEAGED